MQVFKVSGVRATMEECGLDTFETAFVSIEDNKKGIMYACMHAHCQRVIRTHVTIMIAHVQVVHVYIIVMLYFTFPMPGCSLYDSVITLVLGRNGMWPSRDTRRANLFRSKEHTLSDDAGESLGQPDFGREVY